MIELRSADLDHPAVAALLAHHLAQSQDDSPPEFRHALSLDALRHPAITLLAAWEGEALCGFAGLRDLGGGHGEIKSMRTHPDRLRRGTARTILDRLLAIARERGMTRVSLETGTSALFAPANALYEAFGFVDRDPFGDYAPSPHNRFMTLDLTEPPCRLLSFSATASRPGT